MACELILCMIFMSPTGGDGFLNGEMRDAWEDGVTYRMPVDPLAVARVHRAVDWLRDHLVTVSLPEDGSPLCVIAWKDPTLEPAAPKVLAGYLITGA